jgi:hypothetical protein
MERIPGPETLAVAVATLVFGQALGPAVGTLVLIVFGWFGGVIVGVLRMDAEPGAHAWARTLGFVVVSFIVTVGTAGSAATWLAARAGGGSPSDWLFFVAVVIPAVGMDWLLIGKWVASRIGRAIDSRVVKDE